MKDVLGIQFCTLYICLLLHFCYRGKFLWHCNLIHLIHPYCIHNVDRKENQKSYPYNGHIVVLQCDPYKYIVLNWNKQCHWIHQNCNHKLGRNMKTHFEYITKCIELPMQLGWFLNPSWHIWHCLPTTLVLHGHCPLVLLQTKLVEPSESHPQSKVYKQGNSSVWLLP